MPGPVRPTLNVEALLAFVTMTRFAARAPTALGAKLTLTVHVAPGASEAGQLFTRA